MKVVTILKNLLAGIRRIEPIKINKQFGNLKNTLIVIAGPTAVGKTALAIDIAKNYNAEIISADSRQFYKELKIGVAAPSKAELQAVKHHFVGHLSIWKNYNVSRFENEVLDFLSTYFLKNSVAVMVGGSGLYIDAVCEGIDDLPDPEESLRNSLKHDFLENGIDALRQKLKVLDPEYYKKVDLNNPNRLLRALEVCLTTGKPYSLLRKNKKKTRNFNIVKIGLNRPRKELFSIIEDRVDRMIEQGLLEEVRNLLPYKEVNALNTVGYKEIFKYLQGEWSLDLAIEKIKTHTRRYAKRQLTWFNKSEEMQWFQPQEKEKIIAFIKDYVGKNM